MAQSLGDIAGRKILVVDDDLEMLKLLSEVFARADAQVYTAAGGEDALRQVRNQQPDLVLLDLMMPGVDGWQACQQIRQLSDVPIIILTALNHDRHIIHGLELGADDYVTKPFNCDVLRARAGALLRRVKTHIPSGTASVYSDGHLTIDLEARRVLVGGKAVSLSPTEHRLLACLVQNADRRPLAYREILDTVWGSGYEDSVQLVHVYISRLRRKLEDDPGNPKYLLTEHGFGYRFRKRPLG